MRQAKVVDCLSPGGCVGDCPRQAEGTRRTCTRPGAQGEGVAFGVGKDGRSGQWEVFRRKCKRRRRWLLPLPRFDGCTGSCLCLHPTEGGFKLFGSAITLRCDLVSGCRVAEPHSSVRSASHKGHTYIRQVLTLASGRRRKQESSSIASDKPGPRTQYFHRHCRADVFEL